MKRAELLRDKEEGLHYFLDAARAVEYYMLGGGFEETNNGKKAEEKQHGRASGWQVFLSRLSKECSAPNLSKLAGEEWKNMSNEERAPFQLDADERNEANGNLMKRNSQET